MHVIFRGVSTKLYSGLYILFQIPRRAADRQKYFDLEAFVCGVKTSSKRVEAKEQKPFVMIQTDKPIYKPGQKSMIVVCASLQT